MSYKLGLVSVSFQNHSARAVLEAVKDAGLTCIEWASKCHCPPEKAQEIAHLQKEFGIECCSYGTYFKLGVAPMEELPSYIEAAKTIGAPILRLWCGAKNSEEHTAEEKEALFALCKEAERLAREADVILCMECHNNTFTNRKEAAVELMEAINSPHFRMYWQPNQYREIEENIAYAKMIAPYTKHLHVFNWKNKEKFPLQEAVGLWKTYLSCFEGDRTLLLEFMPDGRIETLPTETNALKEIAR